MYFDTVTGRRKSRIAANSAVMLRGKHFDVGADYALPFGVPTKLGIQLMAIYRLFKTMVLGPDEIAILSAAYEDALRVLKIADRQDPITEVVAAKIIKVARLSGAISPETIREQALKELEITPEPPS
jgi:hypothetical protein